jgi:protocatechuate 3,4-dioxygenase beta subunit
MEREPGMKSCHSAPSKRSPEPAHARGAARLRRGGFVLLIFCLGLLLSSIAQAADTARVATDGFSFVDLSAFAIAPDEPTARSLSALPDGVQRLNGVPFRLDRPLAVTGIEAARVGDFFPTAATGIKVGRTARRLHLLHATMFSEKDGTPLAKVVFHYANGTEESVRLGYGVHARSWLALRLEKRAELFDPNSREAWTETDDRRGSRLRLFQTAIENPKPSEVIASIDIVSLFSHATPFFAAITVEGPESKLAANRPASSRKPVRDLREYPDSAYRGELSVRITDAQNGRPVTNAVATLSITDDKESSYFDSMRSDAKGMVRFPYPPQHAVGVSVWVHAPGRMPEVVAESKTNVTKFAGDYSVALKPGTKIGGIVKAADGKPVAGARVIIHQITRQSPHHYTRTEYDVAMTSSDGKWTSDSAPDDLTGFTFQVEHPDYRPILYATLGYAPPYTNTTTTTSTTVSSPSTAVTYRRLADGTLEAVPRRAAAARATVPLVTSNALLSASAEMVLQPAIPVSGIALDSKGRPLPNTEVIFQQNNPFSERKYLRTDAEGRFRTMASAPGGGTLNLVLQGQSPKSLAFNIAAGMAPVEIKLSPPQVLRGRVVDRQQRPVPGAKVRVDQWQGTTDLVKFQTLTDADGNFVWTGAPSDQITFYVSRTNYASTSHSFSGSMANITIPITRQPGIFGKVYDAETMKPINGFTVIPGRKYSTSETRVRWERSDSVRGSGGEYSLRISTSYFQPEARVLCEAPGYEPQVSRAFNGIDAYTNDFALKRGKGIDGIVLLPDGSPAVAAALVLIEKGESAYLDNGVQVRGSGGSSDMVRSDAQGRFEFTPKLEPDKIFVSHPEGFAEAKVANVQKGDKIKLQKWGRLKGLMRVGEAPEPGTTVRLQQNYSPVPDEDGRGSSFSFYLKADPDADGTFAFDKVPPGEHRIALEYHFKDDRYETPLSHGRLVEVKPGETAEVTLGGSGRRIQGHVNLTGGTHADVDWKRDVHRLTLVLPPIPGQPVNAGGNFPPGQEPLVFLGAITRQAAPAIDPKVMRERQRAERMYVLLFDTNGNFHVDNVPPGKYQLMLNPTDPEDDYYNNRRSIGAMNKEIVVPDEKNAKVNAPFDIGGVDLAIQPRLRIGRTVPSFEGKTSDGKTIKLSDFRGKMVVLHFWGLQLGYNTTELTALKEIHASYGTSGKVVILGCNLDADAKNAEQFAQRQGLTWTQIYLGQWNTTPIPAMFGINGSSACVIVDAEGKLASGNFRGTAVRSMVANALSGVTLGE